MTDPSDRARAAQAILSIPLFGDLMDELEAGAVNAAVGAPFDDHESRQGQIAFVRAIRNLRSRIGALANEGQPSGGKRAPA